MRNMEEEIIGTVDQLAFGGKGIVKANSLVVFVPFTAPEDRIRCRLTHRKKNHAEGEVVEIISPSRYRTAPLCPYYGVCGGCQLQHVSYDAQLTYKQTTVFDALHRIGGVKLPALPKITPATALWAYRRHVTLNIAACDKRRGYLAGYIGTDQTTLVPIRRCPIFLDENASLFDELQEVLAALQYQSNNAGRVTVLKGDKDAFLFYFRFNTLPLNLAQVLEKALQRWPHWSGVVAADHKNTFSLGVADTSMAIEGLHFSASPTAFIQNNAEQSQNIYREIVRLSQNECSRILDLYCGIGISSLLLAKAGHKILGVEISQAAIELAKRNAKANGLAPDFVASDAKKGVKKWLAKLNPHLVIVNPPRNGLDPKIIKEIACKKPKRVLYISCMPPTLARDVKGFHEAGYRVQSCHLYDMFPQTSHVEALVELSL